MRSDKCGECGDEFVWDSDAGSAVCLACGTLQDSSQVVLDAHIETEDNAKEHNAFSFYQRATLKSFRNANGWDLAGQGTQAAAERNKIAMREFTAALARRIGHPSLSGRALFLFELAMERGHFRYGRKARLVAGASLAIALRENQKGETIKDIAYLSNESHVALARVFTMIVSLLEVKLVSVDPSWHLLVLQKDLVCLLAESPSHLPYDLIRALKGVHLPSALRTAASLSDLVSRAGIAVNLPSSPFACAIYMLALEGEVLSSLPHCGDLAKALGRRFGVSKEVVMRRYKSVYELVEGWTAEIPWMEGFRASGSSKSAAKVAKRVGIARLLKDSVHFQESLWKTKLEALEPLSVTGDDVKSVSSSEISSVSEVDLQQKNEVPPAKSFRPRKRQKTGHIDDMSHFLLSPLHAGSSEKPRIDLVPLLEAASHMLTSDTPSFRQPLTRLQLLAAVKPVDDITDEELFVEGELDSFLRSAEEREALIQTCDWARAKNINVDDEAGIGEARVIHARMSKHERDSASRLNIEALSRILDEHEPSDGVEATYKDDGDDDNWTLNSFTEQIMTQGGSFENGQCETSFEAGDDTRYTVSLAGGDGGEVVGPWRPLSPSSG